MMPSSPPDPEPPNHEQDIHVLLVEDDPVNQKVVRRMVERLGHRVTVCGDGIEAVELATTHDFDLILMDCQIPGMDGFDATRATRAAGRRMPIIALTGESAHEQRRLCLEAGMNDLLAKPPSLKMLDQIIRRYAGKHEEAEWT